jgi:hypothetical protein
MRSPRSGCSRRQDRHQRQFQRGPEPPEGLSPPVAV